PPRASRRGTLKRPLDVLDTKLVRPPRQEFVELRLGGPDNLVLQHLFQPIDRGIRSACSARAASCHVIAAPPSSVMKSRRLIRLPRRPAQAESAVLRGRAP